MKNAIRVESVAFPENGAGPLDFVANILNYGGRTDLMNQLGYVNQFLHFHGTR
jgi:hypothetical protein